MFLSSEARVLKLIGASYFYVSSSFLSVLFTRIGFKSEFFILLTNLWFFKDLLIVELLLIIEDNVSLEFSFEFIK